jgi:ADP-heptose:LPS heptosyltransferase
VTPADRAASRRAVPDPEDAPLVVVHPGARDPRRRWPAERFAEVADAVADSGARVVLTGTTAERPVVRRVADAMRHHALVVAGELSLSGLVGLLDRAAVVLANDTGPRHLAEAVGTATVSLFWCGNLANAAPLTRARHRVHVSWRTTCPRCGRPLLAEADPERYGEPCDHQDAWVTDVPVDGVLQDVRDLLATGGEGTGR